MPYKNVIKTTIPILCLLFFLSAHSQKQYEENNIQKRPNIIFILVDDQGYGDIGAFFQNQRAQEHDRSLPFERSPHLDQLAKEGTMLTLHYCAAPVCAPSRASIMLGVSQGHANVRDNQFDKALENNYTMPSTLRQLGYSTAIIGKWGLQGDDKFDPNGSTWPAHPLKRGFDYSFSYIRHRDGHEHYPKEGLYDGPKEVWENYTNIASDLDKCYTTDLWTARAKKYIIDHEKGDEASKPFFLYLAYDVPHAVLELPTEQYPIGRGLHGGIQWIGKPGHMINTAEGKTDSYVYPEYAQATYDDDHNPATPEVPWPDTYKRYATANRRIDDAVGDLVQLLKDMKIDSNTLIVYTSDNGASVESYLPKTYVPVKPTFFGSNGPFDGIKRDDWEGGVRIPTIAWWPHHIPAGKVISNPSISYDWLPTFLELAGSPAPVRIDGVSLLPSLTGKGRQMPGLIYNEYYFHGKTPDFKEYSPNHRGRERNQMQFMRIGNYVGVRYDIESANDNFEIYNIVKDPQEKYNLMTKPDKKESAIEERNTINTKVLTKGNVERLNMLMKERVLQVRRPNSSAPRPYDSSLIPPVKPIVEPGIIWKYYRENFLWIPQVEALQPSKSGYSTKPNLKVNQLHQNGTLLFEGFIKVPKDGEYTFYLESDTKAFFRIHDAEVIDEDFGYEAGTEKSASILMKVGLHPFLLYYKKQIDGIPSLNFEWSGPGIPKQLMPGNVFFRNKLK
ncbi:sulfatase-like hydrolase/transferase [Ginsengibacter hankyongi]|uniref:Sulfatase-like hydrolase/transferase n=1 Tax=Ginsengibacter hankyongi TaxID=2607284 RepID=A0A5J5IPZ8_9BACT|nr:sulfatase-like hydrolase/transferase [Ginsengibacter hankyongi]KAA9042097.1 sulfatase-like hydrolase/transferase [Ginsengibacter hankyongi]